MKSTLIWIIGKPGSGKTSLCKELIKLLPSNFKQINIDDFRIKYNTDESIQKEQGAVARLKNEIKKSDFVLLESIYTYGKESLKTFNQVITIELYCSNNICRERVAKRLKDPTTPHIPFPYQTNQDFESKLKSFYKTIKFSEEEILKLHSKKIIQHSIKTESLSKKEILSQVCDLLRSKKIIE